MSLLLSDPVIVVDVAAEPVTLEDAKRHLNMQFDTTEAYEFTDDDNYITSLIPVCREAIERFTGKSLAPKTLRIEVDNHDGRFSLPYGPVTAITEVIDDDGVVDEYTITSGRLLKPKCSYVSVTYEAGYTMLPAALKHAILEEISWRYNHRGDEVNISKPARDLAKLYREVTWLA